MKLGGTITLQDLSGRLGDFFWLSSGKILDLERTWNPARGTPVFTVDGRYTTRGWTEWTQGFQFGCALLQFDATDDERFLDIGRRHTVQQMAPHVTHVGVHDHGFNNISTYGNLRRLMREGRIPHADSDMHFFELALKASGAVQAARWSEISGGGGFIYSFNGPHSLFSDTIRSLRILGLSHQLGHVLMGEGDRPVSLLDRLVDHARATARFNVYYGEGRDAYDVPGRVAHESIFNPNDGQYRCPSTQQGYSPFSTWTRGLAWIITGFAEQLEFFASLPENALADRVEFMALMERAATVTAEFYLKNSCADGIPFWDTGAPGLTALPDYYDRISDPRNGVEPVDSSAAAIAAQGFLRLANYFRGKGGDQAADARYRQAALQLAGVLFSPPYLSTDPRHQGLILHSVYHRPNGWDYCPPGSPIPCGESSMWGDYHAMELAVMLHRELRQAPYPAFFDA